MGMSVFLDKSKPPTETDLAEALGEAKPLWDELKAHVKEVCPDIIEDWKHYGKNYGWTMKLLKKKRNLFFSAPGNGQFAVAFTFGDKAVEAVEKSSLPRDIIDTLKAARKYAEGRGLQIIVNNREDLAIIKKLIPIKLEN